MGILSIISPYWPRLSNSQRLRAEQELWASYFICKMPHIRTLVCSGPSVCCPCGTRMSITENHTIAIEMFSYNFKYFPWHMVFREIWNLNWHWQQRDPVSNFYSLLNLIKIIIVQSEWRVNKKPWVIPCSVSCQIINEIFQSVSLLLNHLWTNSSNTSFIFRGPILLVPYLRSSWKKRVWTCTIKWVLHYELAKVTCTCNSEKCIR